MIFTILVQTARKGKQSWTESVSLDGVSYPDTSVYIGSGLANFSQQHEEKRFQAWKTALTTFWPAHYEIPSREFDSPDVRGVEGQDSRTLAKGVADWETSPEAIQLIQRLLEIGQEGASVSRWVRKSGFGSVRVVYDSE